MPSGYEQSPDYGGRPPGGPWRHALAVVLFIAFVVALLFVRWLVRGSL